jgi:DNA-directed RNA polymerase subunit K/omega
MSSRVELLSRVNSSKTSPFLLCNLLARRAKQLANGQRVATWSGLINVAATEFLEGRLLFEVNGQRVHSSRDARTAETVENEKGSGPGTTRGRGKGKLHPEVDDLETSLTVPVGR